MGKKIKPFEVSQCVFSEDRAYRYSLFHSWRDPETPSYVPHKTIMWVGLNPSVANETQLDNTLRRIKAYSRDMGFDSFYMTNLFGLVSTDPKALYTTPDPVGPDNDTHLLRCAERVDTIVAAWGTHGCLGGRDSHVMDLLRGRLSALRVNKDGSPAHCLYLPKTLRPIPFGLGTTDSLNPPITPVVTTNASPSPGAISD